jgi:hypothetical protein
MSAGAAPPVPARVKVIHGRDFIRAQPEGVLQIEDSLRLLLEIAAAAADLKEHDVVLDMRHVDSQLSAADLWTLSQKLAEYRNVFTRKTAVLCPLERFDKARFFAMSAENQGFNIRAFTAYESAMEWILFDETARS